MLNYRSQSMMKEQFHFCVGKIDGDKTCQFTTKSLYVHSTSFVNLSVNHELLQCNNYNNQHNSLVA